MVPLVILWLVTAAIVEAGKNSGKMLVASFVFVIVSVIASGYFALGASVVTYPCVLPEKLANDFAALTTAEPYFKIAIPPPLDIMTTLALAMIGGLAIVFTKSEALTAVALDGKKRRCRRRRSSVRGCSFRTPWRYPGQVLFARQTLAVRAVRSSARNRRFYDFVPDSH